MAANGRGRMILLIIRGIIALKFIKKTAQTKTVFILLRGAKAARVPE
jgi:hypothetical protein